jgi:dihydroorotase (multifunctional complex type)
LKLLIKNGTVVTPANRSKLDILVVDGKIASLSAPMLISENTADTVIDAEGLYVLPGIIDAHVHFRDPGHTYKEDFSTGSAAAAAGGVTTVFDMPNNMPRTVGKAELEEKLEAIKGKAYVDYALYGLLTSENCGRIEELVRCGIRGFKCLMGISAMNTPTGRDVDIWRGSEILRDTGIPISVHAEDTQIVAQAREDLQKDGRNDPVAHMLSHPPISETLAVERAIMAAEAVGGRIHIAHISAKETVQLIREAKRRGVKVTCEVGPHNLFFTDKDYDRKGSSMFMNPPIRSAEHQQALLEGIIDGTIDMIATDHAPHSDEEKSMKNGVFSAKSGFCGVETEVGAMLTLINRGLLTLEQYAKVGSENAARLFRLYPKKGCIAVGSDADFTIVDMKRSYVVKKENLHSRSKTSAFDGEEFTGMPVYTVVRGNIVMDHGRLSDSRIGEFLC